MREMRLVLFEERADVRRERREESGSGGGFGRGVTAGESQGRGC